MLKKIFPLPISLNKKNFHRSLQKFIHAKNDPRKILYISELSSNEFTKCVSSYKIEHAWKTSAPLRHIHTDKKILSIINEFQKPAILDIGVSDGITSIELIDKLSNNFHKFFITDLYFDIHYIEKDNITYIYDLSKQKCIMRVSDNFIIYFNSKNLLSFINKISQCIYSKTPELNKKCIKTASLCQPILRNLAQKDNRIKIKQYDIFTPWLYNKANIIKVANVLNRSYFTDNKISKAIANIKNALDNNGYLFIVENRKIEKWSLFQKKQNVLNFIEHFNGGSDIEYLLRLALGSQRS